MACLSKVGFSVLLSLAQGILNSSAAPVAAQSLCTVLPRHTRLNGELVAVALHVKYALSSSRKKTRQVVCRGNVTAQNLMPK